MDTVDRIYDTFKGKTIFITGGTGFLGQVLIERLLRIFNIKKVYLLIRTKDKSPRARLTEIFRTELFDVVREVKGDQIFEKCVPITGDIAMENLGISPEDRLTLVNETEIVVHSAAFLNLDAPLKTSLIINTKGTQKILHLAKEMKNLQVFVHVSTMFCHPEVTVMEEKFYPPVADPENFIEMVEMMDEKEIKIIAPAVLSKDVNSYIFSKALAENVVAKYLGELPIITIRPALVLPMWKQPLPGWATQTSISAWLTVGVGRGVVRSILGLHSAFGHLITVDAAIDTTCCCIADSITNKRVGKVYNLANFTAIKWGEYLDTINKVNQEDIHFNGMFWYPRVRLTSNRVLHYFITVVFQLLPALIVDFLLNVAGYKPFLFKIQRYVTKAFYFVEVFTNNIWIMMNKNVHEVRNWLNDREKSNYVTDMNGFDCRAFIVDSVYATRRYILKEPDEDIPVAKTITLILFYLERTIVVLALLFLLPVATYLYIHRDYYYTLYNIKY